MITPKFQLKQDEDYVVVIIYAPYVRAQDVDISIAETVFTFYCKPYFLRLAFENSLSEDGREKAVYTAETREFVISVPKKVRGEPFNDLTLLTKLLAPPKVSESKFPHIEDASLPGGATEEVGDAACSDDEAEDQLWYIEQHLEEGGAEESIAGSQEGYGFAGKIHGAWTKLAEHASELLDIREPDALSIHQRKALQKSQENERFSEDHYLADLYDNPELDSVLSYVPWYQDLLLTTDTLLQQKSDRLMALPRRRYMLTDAQKRNSYLSLVDLVYAYCYNERITQGEDNVESPWNVRKVSAMLSCLVPCVDIMEVVLSCIRRSICYPLVRNWDLSMKILDDTRRILACGKRSVLLCLLGIHRMFSGSEPHYILNDLYITDTCVWLQSASDKKVQSLSSAIAALSISKSDVGFGLPVLEQAAALAMRCAAAAGDSHNDIAGCGALSTSPTESPSGDDSSSSGESSSDSESSSDGSSSCDSESEASSDRSQSVKCCSAADVPAYPDGPRGFPYVVAQGGLANNIDAELLAQNLMAHLSIGHEKPVMKKLIQEMPASSPK